MSNVVKFPDAPWDWKQLSTNSAITCEVISFTIDKPWDFQLLSKHRKVATWEFVMHNLDKPWDWNCLYWNRYFTPFENENENYSVNSYLTEEKKEMSLTEEQKSRLHRGGFDWVILSGLDTDLPMQQVIRENPEENWNWRMISLNNDIATWEFVNETSTLSWDWKGLSVNSTFVGNESEEPLVKACKE